MSLLSSPSSDEAIAFALSLPGTFLGSAYRHSAVRIKVSGRVLLFSRPTGSGNQISLKLAESLAFATDLPGIKPMGHGYGKWGWVTIKFDEITVERELLLEFIREAYSLVVPRS